MAAQSALPVADPAVDAAVQSMAVTSHPLAVPTANPYLRVVGVVRSSGAVLADAPSGTSATVLPAGEIVTLLERSEDDGWLQVMRSDGSTGWVNRLALLTAGTNKLPQIVAAPAAAPAQIPDPATAAPAAEMAPTETASVTASAPVLATIRTDGSRLNVRSGPGADSPVVAKADNASSYPALATSADEAWVQIEIADAPDGSGWVSARFVTLSDQ